MITAVMVCEGATARVKTHMIITNAGGSHKVSDGNKELCAVSYYMLDKVHGTNVMNRKEDGVARKALRLYNT